MAERSGRRRWESALAACLVCLASSPAAQAGPARTESELAGVLVTEAPALDRGVLELALRASTCARGRGLVPDPATLTVIDYSRPSTEPRLWVLDVARRALLHEELVAHGRGTGEDRAERFSNVSGSRQSSLGLFVTLDTYVGRHGRSLRMRGLEPGVNDRALERALVIHGADYVSRTFAALHGRLGRSWGCPALAPDVAQGVIDRIRGGTPVFAYYPDPAWLASSRLLACGGDEVAAGG